MIVAFCCRPVRPHAKGNTVHPSSDGLLPLLQRAFFNDYAAAHEAVTRMGTTLAGPPGSGSHHSLAANGQAFTNTEVVIGAAVLVGAAVVVGLAWYNRRRKLLRRKV